MFDTHPVEDTPVALFSDVLCCCAGRFGGSSSGAAARESWEFL